MQRLRFALFILLLVVLCRPVLSQTEWKRGRLMLSENKHYLQFKDGTPFFWLGDTAWELFGRLTKEEIGRYLENRRQKGFNVIQAVVLANTDRAQSQNRYGEFPLIDNDPERPNEKYFELVDWTIQQALQSGIFMGLLPTWGDKVSKFWGKGPVIFNEANAYNYGLFLGKRYGHYPNIIWIAGGDRPAFSDSTDWRPVWRAVIKGIRTGSAEKALVTYHPWGEHSSADFWGDEPALDFNMFQSGHASRDIDVSKWVTREFNAVPVKPVLDGEPNYEDHPINWKKENGYFRDYDVRKQLYRSVFLGGCGVTYGHQAIWQFYSAAEKPISFPDRYWNEALDRPGAFQAGYLKKLILSRPSLKRIPDQSIIKSAQGEKGEYMTAFRDEDNTYAMVYIPVGREVEINTAWMKGGKVIASWFDPRTGNMTEAGKRSRKTVMTFSTPTKGVEQDWVLVLDAAKADYSKSVSQDIPLSDGLDDAGVARFQERPVETERWGRFEIALTNGRDYTNPFRDVDLLAAFTSPTGETTTAWGFYDGSQTWKLRFMPSETGAWKYVVYFSDQPAQKITGRFVCVPSDIPGLISADETNPVWFGFKGGKHIFIRSFHVGDRFFASNWPDQKRQAFLNWAAKNKYNTLSVASHYLNRNTEGRGQGWDTPNLWNSEIQQPDPVEYAEMERMLDDLARRNMIVFPFGGFFGQRAGYPRDKEDQLMYIKYTTARLGAHWNLLFNVSGPEPLLARLKEFTKDQLDQWGKWIDSLNVSKHLVTVHNKPNENPFIYAPWASYQCLQGPKTVDPNALYGGIMKLRNIRQPVYAQETLWYGNTYHHDFVGREYTDDDLRRNAWIIAMAGTALNFADNTGDSSTGFSGTLDMDEIHQDKHDIINKVWDFFETIPFYSLTPSPDLVDNGFCLADPGVSYLVYLPYGGQVRIETTPGCYRGEWIKGSDTSKRVSVELDGSGALRAPTQEDWVLHLNKCEQR